MMDMDRDEKCRLNRLSDGDHHPPGTERHWSRCLVAQALVLHFMLKYCYSRASSCWLLRFDGVSDYVVFLGAVSSQVTFRA